MGRKTFGEYHCFEGHNSETKHFQTCIVVNVFYYLHMGNTYLKLCPLFLNTLYYNITVTTFKVAFQICCYRQLSNLPSPKYVTDSSYSNCLFLIDVTDPVGDVLAFIRLYEEKYGHQHPVFYQGTYSQALNDAKQELRFLLVYLHCEEHQDTANFCR